MFYNPNLITISSGFYLCGGHIILVATGANAPMTGVTISQNQFAGTCGRTTEQTVQIDQSNGTFATPVDVTIRDNMVSGPWVSTGTEVTRTIVATTPTSTWTVDFSPLLLFNTTNAPIKTVKYSFMLDDGQFASSSARKPVNDGLGHVVVETDAPVTGSLTVTVDQSARSQS